jgi:D-serine deaminase-like pyridoxal phosphate-dependent protein
MTPDNLPKKMPAALGEILETGQFGVVKSGRAEDNCSRAGLISPSSVERNEGVTMTISIGEIETPAIAIDLDLVESNIQRLQAYLEKHGVANRPHIKTHKIPEIGRLQMLAGATGICCQKLGEAEIMADNGFADIFLPYNILGGRKLARLGALLRRVSIRVTADSEITIAGLSEAARAANRDLTVLVEFDTGAGRCGVQTPSEAAALARLISGTQGLRFGGLMTYPMNDRTGEFVEATRKLLAGSGLAIETVSAGGSHTMWQVHEHPEVTEYRAGMYVYGDRYTVHSGAMKLEQCAFKVLATVVSRPTADRGILDAGSKSLSSDLLGLNGHGLILEYPEAVIRGLSEEHGNVDLSRSARRPEIGERISILPNHCCVVTNLFDRVYGVRKGVVEKVFSVAARGAVT